MERYVGNESIILTFLVIVTALLIPTVIVPAEEHRTPYGDYQDWCGAYGVCKEDMSPKDAEIAITRYFSSKGMRVGKVQHRGRFVEAEIYGNGTLKDKIIFDRKTGRLRSAY